METWQIFILIAGGVFIIGCAIRVLLLKKYLLNNGERTTATVLRTERRRMGKGWTYIPILEYTVDGHMYVTEHHGNTRPKYEDGETLEIIYHKDNPNKAMFTGDNVQYVGSIIFMIIGLAIIGVGLSQLL